MKRILVILILSVICQYACSQHYNNSRSKHPIYGYVNSPDFNRSMIISGAPTVLFDTPWGTQWAGGLKIQFFISQRFSVDGDMVLSNFYSHWSPGLFTVPLAFLAKPNSDDHAFGQGLLYVSLLAVALEHVSYHLPVFKNFDVSPFVSLLRYKVIDESVKYWDPTSISEQFCFATGLQLNKYIGRFVFSPYAEYYIGYRDYKSGYNVGIYLGILFRSKKRNNTEILQINHGNNE